MRGSIGWLEGGQEALSRRQLGRRGRREIVGVAVIHTRRVGRRIVGEEGAIPSTSWPYSTLMQIITIMKVMVTMIGLKSTDGGGWRAFPSKTTHKGVEESFVSPTFTTTITTSACSLDRLGCRLFKLLLLKLCVVIVSMSWTSTQTTSTSSFKGRRVGGRIKCPRNFTIYRWRGSFSSDLSNYWARIHHTKANDG